MSPVCTGVVCKEAGQEGNICAECNACVTHLGVFTDIVTHHAASNDAAKPQRPNDKRCGIHFASHMAVLRHQDGSCHVED